MSGLRGEKADLDPNGGGSSGVCTEEFSFGLGFCENMVVRVVICLANLRVAKIKAPRRINQIGSKLRTVEAQ